MRSSPTSIFRARNVLRLIRVEGVILDAQATIGELKHYGENPLVKAIVLRIDSPGGGVVPSQEIHDAVKRVVTKAISGDRFNGNGGRVRRILHRRRHPTRLSRIQER